MRFPFSSNFQAATHKRVLSFRMLGIMAVLTQVFQIFKVKRHRRIVDVFGAEVHLVMHNLARLAASLADAVHAIYVSFSAFEPRL